MLCAGKWLLMDHDSLRGRHALEQLGFSQRFQMWQNCCRAKEPRFAEKCPTGSSPPPLLAGSRTGLRASQSRGIRTSRTWPPPRRGAPWTTWDPRPASTEPWAACTPAMTCWYQVPPAPHRQQPPMTQSAAQTQPSTPTSPQMLRYQLHFQASPTPASTFPLHLCTFAQL